MLRARLLRLSHERPLPCDFSARYSSRRHCGEVGDRLHIGFPDPARATGGDVEKMAVFPKVRDDGNVEFRERYDTQRKGRS